MSTITLLGFTDPRVTYVLDLGSGTYTATKARRAEEIDSVGFSGFGDEMKIGILRRRAGFFAAFVDEGAMKLWLDRSLVDCSRGTEWRAKRTIAGPFLRCFVLEGDGKRMFSARYWLANSESWPTCGDIFSFIIERVGDVAARTSFVRFWSAVHEGREIPITQ